MRPAVAIGISARNFTERIGVRAGSRAITVPRRIRYAIAGRVVNANAVRAADADSVYYAVSLRAVSCTFGNRRAECAAVAARGPAGVECRSNLAFASERFV